MYNVMCGSSACEHIEMTSRTYATWHPCLIRNTSFIYARDRIPDDIDTPNAKEEKWCSWYHRKRLPSIITYHWFANEYYLEADLFPLEWSLWWKPSPVNAVRLRSAIWRDSQVHRIWHQREFPSIEVTGAPLIGVINERHLSRRIHQRRSWFAWLRTFPGV